MALGVYRTKTYLAGDWTGDSVAINQIRAWNEGDKWSLRFRDVHSITQSRDSSLPCTIKASLRERMNVSKTFVLVVGEKTNNTRAGSCSYEDCPNKSYLLTFSGWVCTAMGKNYSTQSYVDYECELARKAYDRGEMKIVVLYNSSKIDRNKCPEPLRYIGTHIEMKDFNWSTMSYYYSYNKVRKAIEGLVQ